MVPMLSRGVLGLAPAAGGVAAQAQTSAGSSVDTVMGAKLEMVKTSWANLMPDFTASRCAIAIGGISVTTERQK